MKKISIHEEDDIHLQWFQELKEIDNTKDLLVFIERLLNDYDHDYGTVCHATVASALATIRVFSKIEGMTGNQMGFVMWGIIKELCFRDNKLGLKIIDYDNLLYPQYEDKFKFTITNEKCEALQFECYKKIKNTNYRNAHIEVLTHWYETVNGKKPFGCEIKN